MDIEVIPEENLTVVRLSGRITDGEAAEQLRAALKKLVSEGRVNTVVDLGDVSWFDSIGLGLLINHYISCGHRNGRVVLLRADDKIRTLLQLSRLEDRFGWATELTEARALFEPSTPS